MTAPADERLELARLVAEHIAEDLRNPRPGSKARMQLKLKKAGFTVVEIPPAQNSTIQITAWTPSGDLVTVPVQWTEAQ